MKSRPRYLDTFERLDRAQSKGKAAVDRISSKQRIVALGGEVIGVTTTGEPVFNAPNSSVSSRLEGEGYVLADWVVIRGQGSIRVRGWRRL